MRLVLVLLTLILWAPVAQAAEQRCTELGANCVCSEPFQMTGYTKPQSYYWDPTDSTTKECGEETAGAPVARPTQDIIVNTNATALAALPSGHSVARFMSSAPNNSGIFFVGSDATVAALGSTFNKRMAQRGYVYFSPDYNFRDDTPACHSKFLQGQVGAWHIENAYGDNQMYQFTGVNWGPGSIFPRDCCWSTPGETYAMTKANWRGRWFRVESVVTNRAGGSSPNGVRFQVYMQDVTNLSLGPRVNNGAEWIVADWRGTASGPNPWGGWDYITSSPAQRPMSFNYYREVPAGGQCNGWRGISHMMTAGWDTDTGQRIGAAAEVESGGGGGDTTPPAAPTGVTITKFVGKE